jgi:hypothetical protein
MSKSVQDRLSNRKRSARRLIALVLGVQLLPAFVATPAHAIEPLIKAVVTDRSVPDCTSASVIETVRGKFAASDAGVLHAGLALSSVDRIAQTYAGQDDPSPYARRYCTARATLSNGKTTTLYYLVEQQAGFVGVTWNVDACLAGYEPWNVHDGRCHTVRHRWW